MARRRRGLVATTVAGVVLSCALTGTAARAAQPAASTARPAQPLGAVTAAATVTYDGSSSATAAASCWGIKQEKPTATDGLYWLVTPQLVSPRQFWCDMTTDGGGWVLVGRGREGWSWRDRGQGNAANVARIPAGTGAFSVQYYPSSLVDALLGGARPDALTDGVRVRRARNAAGTSWQEVRYALKGVPQWSWAFGAGLPTSSVTVAANRYTVASTYDTYPVTGNDVNRVFTFQATGRAVWGTGFAYGASACCAANTTTSYLWQSSRSEGLPVPFAQVYLRPKLAAAAGGGTALPDAGLPASTVRHLLSQVSEPLSGWGVTGYDQATSPATGWKSNAIALAQIGDRVYVGGTFQAVQKGASGTPVRQRYLAAFNRLTGAFDPSFTPVLNGGVWALAATAEGALVAGGRFTTVNGTSVPGLVALNPVTGARLTTWNASPSLASGTPSVRSLAVQDGWVYVGGTMTSISGGFGALGRRITVSHVARVASTTGRPDTAWRPQLASQPWSITTSSRGDRVYLAGAFTSANGVATYGTAVVNTANGASVPGLAAVTPSFVCAPNCAAGYHPYAQAMLESRDGARVYAAPTEHNLQLLSSATMGRTYSHITLSGGDYQSLVESDGVLYASCHCFGYDYSGRVGYKTGTADRINSINGLAAYDATTLRLLDGFEPSWKGAYSDGTWASLLDSAGCVWFAGDVVQGSLGRWAGGFLKFCPRDASAPLAPFGLSVSRSGTGAFLSWSGGGDASGAVTYQVLRDDRVIGTTTDASWTDPVGYAGARYAVRAADPTGNLSATTPVRTYAG